MNADTMSRERRSWTMAQIRSVDTTPEKRVRSLLHRLGYRFRLHRKDLPGRPDIVLPKHRTVILVHGCFWHRHKGCKKTTSPKSNVEFWESKFERNMLRDRRNGYRLRRLGWRVRVIWECQTESEARLHRHLRRALRT